MTAAVQLAEMLGASWVLWRVSAWCYRTRVPDDARDLDRWPVEEHEPPVGPSGGSWRPPRTRSCTAAGGRARRRGVT